MFRRVLFLLPILFIFTLAGCGSDSTSPKAVAEQFWSSAKDKKLDEAKQLVSWQSADYLRYIEDKDLVIAHVDLGEVVEREDITEIDTVVVLKREKGDDIRLPTKTILIKTEGVWRIQLKSTLAAVLRESVKTAANQFNQVFSQGLNELDKVLDASVNEMTQTLELGVKELNKTLEMNAEHFGQTLDQIKNELESSHTRQQASPAQPSHSSD